MPIVSPYSRYTSFIFCGTLLIGGNKRKEEECTFFDFRVLHPFADSNNRGQLAAVYRRHELEKRRHYEERILQVEHGSFVPLIFSVTGGMGKAAQTTFKRLASIISIKQDKPYSMVLNWICTQITFSIDLITYEGKIPSCFFVVYACLLTVSSTSVVYLYFYFLSKNELHYYIKKKS